MRVMQITKESFLKDVSNHKMEILHDAGLYRHVRFKKPNSSDMFFDIVTWGGYLAYSGDMGCFVFSRIQDMFDFFRVDRNHSKDENSLSINPYYWSEKLQAVDGNRTQASAKEFDVDKFERTIYSRLIDWFKSYKHSTTKAQRRELWESVELNIINIDGDSIGARQTIAAYDFYHSITDDLYFSFQDLWEIDFTEYTPRFIWCCYALAWGIKQYDDEKTASRLQVI